MIYIFGEYEFDDRLYELRRAGEHIKIEPKVFDVLAFLIQHRNCVVTKTELMETLWPGEFITESALVRCVVAARKALGDDGVRQQVIKTLRGRGYRFVASIEERDALRDRGATQSAAIRGRSVVAVPGASHTDSAVFVGRQRELRELRAALEHALGGHGRLVLLVGEPGIGKTRTAQELAAQARERHALVLSGQCYKGEGAPAFWPWVQMIRAFTRDRDPTQLLAVMGARAADIAEVVPEVRQALPGLPKPPTVELEQGRFRFFDGMTTFLRNITQEQPLVLVLDDLHWADKPSLLLLQFLAREIQSLRLFVIGTYNDAGLGRQHPLAQTLGELAREEIGQRLPMRGLNQRDVARFIEHMTGSHPGDALVSLVYRKTEGNPFFMKEIARLLASDGRLQQQDQAASWQLTVPREIREVIGRRLAHLSEPCNRLLSVASVIGRTFSLDILEQLSNLAGERLIEVVEEAIAAHIVDELPCTVGHYRFSHALIHETLYDELTTTRRVRLHRRIGETLERLYASHLEPYLNELAHHFLQSAQAGMLDKAISYATRAAERAATRLAYEEAATHYSKALYAMEQDPRADAAQRVQLVRHLGEMQMKAGDVRQAEATLAKAEALQAALPASRSRPVPPLAPPSDSRHVQHRRRNRHARSNAKHTSPAAMHHARGRVTRQSRKRQPGDPAQQ
jgi:predicted ATPase